jgi:hypothetical protein
MSRYQLETILIPRRWLLARPHGGLYAKREKESGTPLSFFFKVPEPFVGPNIAIRKNNKNRLLPLSNHVLLNE